MSKIQINNEIILMRNDVAQARLHMIKKLTREANKLRQKKGTDAQKAKNLRKAERLVAEILAIKKVKRDKITHHALTNTLTLKEILMDTKSEPLTRIMTRIADHKKFSQKITEFKTKYPTYLEFLGPGRKKKAKIEQRKLKKEKNKGNIFESIDTELSESVNDKNSSNESDSNDDESNTNSEHEEITNDVELNKDENKVKKQDKKEFEEQDENEVEEQDRNEIEEQDENEVEEQDQIINEIKDSNTSIDETKSQELLKVNSKKNHTKTKQSTKSLLGREKKNKKNDEKSLLAEEKKNKENEEKSLSDKQENKEAKEKSKIKKKKIVTSKVISKEATVKKFTDILKDEESKLNKDQENYIDPGEPNVTVEKEIDPFFVTDDGESNYLSVAIKKSNYNTEVDESGNFNKFNENKRKYPIYEEQNNHSFGKNPRFKNSNSKLISNKPDSNWKNKPDSNWKNKPDSNWKNKPNSNWKNQQRNDRFDKTERIRNTNKFNGENNYASISSNKQEKAQFKEKGNEILHPSWEAKKKQQEVLKQGFQGKKIVFGDDL